MGIILGLYWDNGQENGSYYSIIGHIYIYMYIYMYIYIYINFFKGLGFRARHGQNSLMYSRALLHDKANCNGQPAKNCCKGNILFNTIS